MWVASYCRVSTDREDQANSFASQQRYFREYVRGQPDWVLYETYADEGITGTSTKRRDAFNRMMEDARQGKFQLILTKEVSRFSRNILDTIAYTRELRQLGIGVLFLSDGIHTLDPDAELRLSIMGSIAQEESRRTSSRVKWGQTRQMERGIVFGRSLLGYDVKDGNLTVNPEGAEVVQLIFQKYGVEKKATGVIARELREAGYRTPTGQNQWSNSHIIKILKNEKYVGDLVQKKTYTPDYLTHAKKANRGQEPLVVLRDHHQPIIDRQLWDLVQSELKKRCRRTSREGGCSNLCLFSGKIRCGLCGASFVSRRRSRSDGTGYRRWRCGTAVREGRDGCGIGRSIRDETAVDMLRQCLGSLPLEREPLIEEVTRTALAAVQAGDAQLTEKIRRLNRKRENVLDAFLAGDITRAEMLQMKARYEGELAALERQRHSGGEADAAELREQIQKYAAGLLDGSETCETFYKTVLDRMTVYPDGRVEVGLTGLPQRWIFQLERRREGGDHFDSFVPMSVNSPFSSG